MIWSELYKTVLNLASGLLAVRCRANWKILTAKQTAVRPARFTPGNVCAVQLWVCITLVGVHYPGGIPSLPWWMFITLVGYHNFLGGIPSLPWRDIIITLLAVHYSGGIPSLLWWISATVRLL